MKKHRTLLYFCILLFIFCCSKLEGFSQAPACPQVTINTPSVSLVCPQTTTLTATVQGTVATNTYVVSSITYSPNSYTSGAQVLVNIDDTWTNSIALPFCFDFFGSTYNSVAIGSNGIITFDVAAAAASISPYPPYAGYWCPWMLINTPYTVPQGSARAGIPNAFFPKYSIMAPYQDIDPTNQGKTYWEVIGSAPCRTLIVSFYHTPYFG